MCDDDEPASAGLVSVVQLRRAAEADLGVALWQLTDAQAREGLAGSFAVVQQAHAAYLRRSLIWILARGRWRARPATQFALAA